MTWVAGIIGAAALVALALGGVDRDLATALTSAVFAFSAMIVLIFPQALATIIPALRRHWAAVSGLALLALLAWASGGPLASKPLATSPHAASLQAASFVSLGLAAVGAFGAAHLAGRHRLLAVLLVIPLILAVLILVDHIDGVGDFFGQIDRVRVNAAVSGPFQTREELGAVFALFVLLGAFAAIDELRRRPMPGAINFPPLSRRLILPVAAVLVGLNVLAVSGARGAMVSIIPGILVMWAVMSVRLGPPAQATRASPAALAAAGSVALAALAVVVPPAFEALFATNGDRRPYLFLAETVDRAAAARPWLGYGFGAYPTVASDLAQPDGVLSGFVPASADLATWRVEAGVFGLLLAIAVLAAFLWPLGLAKDRNRQPSRGLGLALGVCVVCLISGVAQAILSTPAIAHFAALLFGFSAAFVDAPRQREDGPPRRARQGIPSTL